MKKRLFSALLSALILFTGIPFSGAPLVDAASKNEGTATIRIFSTTDLHGQSTTYSYDTASLHKNGSLAQIAYVIKQSKKNLKYGNTLLVDSGDTIFGLGAKSIMEGKVPSSEQYMYKLMKSMGYDAITPGNHDFDYGYAYEKKALSDTGLSSKTVLCNVYEAKTGKSPWAKRKIIKKKVKTTKGKWKTVKIGVTGAVVPGLSTYTPWKGVLVTTDILEAVEEQVGLLKDEGADVVVVLAHSGIGEEEYPDEMAENVCYQIADIDGVNVVCAGHTHLNYPVKSESYTQKILDYENATDSGKLYGKAVVQEADHGQSVGITDLKFSFKKGKKPQLTKKTVKVRKITADDPEDQTIVEKNDIYDRQFKTLCEKSEAVADSKYDNYFGMIEDNALVQLANDAKIAHAQKVIAEKKPEYASYPIIASTTYNAAGGDSPDNYIDSDGYIRLKDLLKLQMYAQEWSKFYYITGAQLKEALEWQASAYQKPDQAVSSKWKDENINNLVVGGTVPVLSPGWENWEGLTVFDGVEYVIDPSQSPRYNRAGNLINPGARRIRSLTCNGKPVSDNQIFVWVTRNMTNTHWPMIGDDVKNQQIISKTQQLATVVEEYVNEQQKFGSLQIKADENWRVDFPEAGNYLVKTSSTADDRVLSKPWYVATVMRAGGYSYHLAKLGGTNSDNAGPLLVAAPLMTETSGEPIDIAVSCSDASGVTKLQYAWGNLTEYDKAWNTSKTVENGKFTVSQNGVYSVRGMDRRGNYTITHVMVGNIDLSVATAPKVNKVKNTKFSVSGTGYPGAKVYVEIKGGTYETYADETGKFTCATGALMADDSVYVWQKDTKDRVSGKVQKLVERYGANLPSVDKITNKKTGLTGTLNDSGYCKIAVIRGSRIYIPEGQKSKFKRTSIYENNKDKTIVETDYFYDSDDNTFDLRIPNLYADQKVKVYAYDWISRAGKAKSYKVSDVAPNRPELETVIAQEGEVYGYIPDPKASEYDIVVEVNGEEYTGKAGANGEFMVKTEEIGIGDKVTVTASDKSAAGKVRTSRKHSEKAKDAFAELSKQGTSKVYIEDMDSKETTITGYVDLASNQSPCLMIGSRNYKITPDETGEFEYELSAPKKFGTKIGLMIRANDGEVISYDYIKVELAKPDEPDFVTEKINTKTKIVMIKSQEKALAYLTVGGRKFKSYKFKTEEKSSGKWYYYYFKVDKLKKGKKVRAYLKNDAGKSPKAYFGKVKKVKKKKKKKEED